MYTYVALREIIERVEHIRELHRQINRTNDRMYSLRREQKIKDFISNLRRTSSRPMLNMVREMEEACSLTTGGGHRLFGYELDGIREFDGRLNSGRTHIIESYVFERDLRIELPLELAPGYAFARTATLGNLVRRWQSNIPIRALDGKGWKRAGTFYVHVGTQESLGSDLPPGAVALVEPIDAEEAHRPNPRSIYLLQFRNGYRCSRCVVTQTKLQLLTSDRTYQGPETFPFPASVRITGRIRAFAVELPLHEYPLQADPTGYHGTADLILPWEHPTRDRLFATKHRRFVRSAEEDWYVQDLLQPELKMKLSDRTRRRYRHQTASEPHVDALIQMSIEHYARYTDSLRTGGYALHDKRRFSLETMLRARRYEDMLSSRIAATIPTPTEVWEARLREFVEWPALLSLKFPQPSLCAERVIRVAERASIAGGEPHVRAGSWLLTEELSAVPDIRSDASKQGWHRPLYVLRRGLDVLVGYMERNANGFALRKVGEIGPAKLAFGQDELPKVRRVSGALVPI